LVEFFVISCFLPSGAENTELNMFTANGALLENYSNLKKENSLSIRPLQDVKVEIIASDPDGNNYKSSRTVEMIPGYFAGDDKILRSDSGLLAWEIVFKVKETNLYVKDENDKLKKLKSRVSKKGVLIVQPEISQNYIFEITTPQNQTPILYEHALEVVELLTAGSKVITEGKPAHISWRGSPFVTLVKIEEEMPDGTRKLVKDNLQPEGRITLKPLVTKKYTSYITPFLNM